MNDNFSNLENNKQQSVFLIELDKIKPNPYQPRIHFDEAKLNALANSIKQYGVLQPIVVTRQERYQEGIGITSEYEIIAGERRFKASRLAGLNRIPAIIRAGEHTDLEKFELAIIENLQREDLNPIDKAKAFKKLVDEFGMKHSEIAAKLGKSREFVSNSLRLLLLPEALQDAVVSKQISEGHTRPLLMLKEKPEEQMMLFRKIITNRLTVRSAEKIAREIAVDKVRRKTIIDPEIKAAESKLSEKLGTKVSIEQKQAGDSGKITIEFFSKDDLTAILNAVKNNNIQQPISPISNLSNEVAPIYTETVSALKPEVNQTPVSTLEPQISLKPEPTPNTFQKPKPIFVEEENKKENTVDNLQDSFNSIKNNNIQQPTSPINNSINNSINKVAPIYTETVSALKPEIKQAPVSTLKPEIPSKPEPTPNTFKKPDPISTEKDISLYDVFLTSRNKMEDTERAERKQAGYEKMENIKNKVTPEGKEGSNTLTFTANNNYKDNSSIINTNTSNNIKETGENQKMDIFTEQDQNNINKEFQDVKAEQILTGDDFLPPEVTSEEVVEKTELEKKEVKDEQDKEDLYNLKRFSV